MRLKRTMAIVLCFAMVLSTMSFSVFAEGTYVAKVGDVECADATGMLNALNTASGEVTVEIYGKLETSGFGINNTNIEKLSFVGKTDSAEICVDGAAYIDVRSTQYPVEYTNLTLSHTNGAYGIDGRLQEYFSTYNGGDVTYTECTFPNGVVALGSTTGTTVTFNQCVFNNLTSGKYSLWVDGNGTNVVVNGGEFSGVRGAKLFAENGSAFSTLEVNGATFFDTITEKAAVVLTRGEEVVLEDNTFNNTTDKVQVDDDYASEIDGKTVVVDGAEYTVDSDNLALEEKVPVPSGSNSLAYTKEVDGYVRVWGQSENTNAVESYVLKLYSDDTLIATTVLNNIGNIIDGSQDSITWNFFYPESNDEYWTTTWEAGHPNAGAQPTKVELYIDGVLLSTTDAKMSAADDLNPVVWAELGGVAPAIPEVIEIYDWEDIKELDARVEGGDMLEGVTVKLMNDIDLYEMGTDGEPVTFNPIGANNSYFKGTFDGQGHTIKNMYQSGWALGYDWYNYGTIGLFAYLWDATVKDLTIENAECFVEGGNVAAIAGCAWGNCTFENITVKNSTFATYNNRAAGIVGYTGGEGTMTFKGITIDEDTVIAALWGSYDCTLGGVVGSTKSPTKFHFEDVTVECKLDCYNDVTASYKWYSYRMCGMLIGRMETLQTDAPTEVDPRGVVTIDNVNITIGEWANQTYIFDDSLSKGCQRVEPGYQYGGVDVSLYPDAEITDLGFNTIIGGPQSQSQGYYGSDITKLEELDGFDTTTLYVEDLAEIARSNVAKIGDTYFASLQDAVNAANDGDVITLINNINLADADLQILDGSYDTYFLVEGKTVTVDLNGKTISGAYTGSMLVGVFSTDKNGHLTITGNGTVDVTATGKVYALVACYNDGSTITIENGTYKADKVSDSLIFYGGKTDDALIVKGGTFTLGNVGTGENGKPWIFNVVGAGDHHVLITGGTFNADINRQHWSNETVVDENCYTVKNGNGTYTVKEGAVAYVKTGMLTGPYYAPKNIGYATLTEAIAAAVEANDSPVVLIKDITDAEEFAINANSPIVLDLNGNTLNGAIKPSTGDITVKNGSIVNKNPGISAIEINSGKLTLENVNIDSARHTVRIDGDVTAVVNGGTYKTIVVDAGKTQHAFNISGTADVTISNGTFTGPKGTAADSGSAINVKTGSVVTINGGNFSGGKNSTLSASGTMTVYGGTFDQDPSAYVAEGYVADKNDDNTYSVKIATVKIGNVGYSSLAKAVEVVQNDEIITLLADITDGTGIKVESGKNFTLDLGGFTYTIASNPVGSKGTETLGFQLLKDSNITIKNGNITSETGSGVKLLVMNYANLTLDGVELDGANLDDVANAGGYVMSNNNGTTVIKDSTITAPTDGVAFDVDYQASYPNGAKVSLEGNTTINGAIVYEKNAQNSLVKDATVTADAPDGYKWSIINDTTMTLVPVVGYSFELVADKEKLYEEGEEVTITLNVNSNDADTFYSISGKLGFDHTKLEYTGGASTDGTIKVQQMYIGEDEGFAVGAYKTFTFKVLDDIAADETLTFTMNGVVYGTEEDALIGADNLDEAKETVDLVAPYTVILPEELTGASTVIHGNEYVVSVKAPSELHKNTTYTITYTCGENTGVKVVTSDDSTFTVPAEDIVGPLSFNFTSENKLEVEVKNNFVTGHTLVLVKGDAKGYLINVDGTDYAMYQVGNYKYGENNEKQARAWVVKGAMTKEQAFDLITIDEENVSVKIAEGYNVNAFSTTNGLINFADATAAHASYQIRYDIPAYVRAYLASDVNADYQVTSTDVNAILKHADYVE